MREHPFKFGDSRPHGRLFRALQRFVFAALLVGFFPHFASAAAAASPNVSASRGLPFAVADFDGDHHPDFASVMAEERGADDYWVRLRLSGSGRRYVRVAAPEGGLSIEARDVNGDHTVDLVVATAWLNQPVAILLNDGHGNFSQVDPTAFPGAFRKSKASWDESKGLFSCVLGLPQQRPGEFSVRRYAESRRVDAGPLRISNSRFAPNEPAVLCAGRAPPLAIFR